MRAARKKEQLPQPRSDADEIEFWRRRASRLRNVLLDISGGCDEPRQRASDAIEAERDARGTGK